MHEMSLMGQDSGLCNCHSWETLHPVISHVRGETEGHKPATVLLGREMGQPGLAKGLSLLCLKRAVSKIFGGNLSSLCTLIIRHPVSIVFL